ncbi:MAG: branched-chain amino acid ABC transporter permease [Dehalococcoidia bacterium]
MIDELLKPRTLWLTLLGVVIVVFPFVHEWPFFDGFVGEFRTFNATMFGVWLLVVLSMNLLTGYSGQISLGHAAVVLIGAYSTGILSQDMNIPLALAIPIAGIFTGAVGGIVIGLPAVRLTGPYLAIATFSLIITLPQILKLNLIDGWTNGANGIGISRPQPPGFFDSFLDQAQWMYYVTMSVAILMTILFWTMTRSRFGRAFVALRDSEIGAEQMGVNVPFYKALAFAISSFYAGIAGGLFFAVQTFVSPESLGFRESILFLVAIVIGGLATVLGSVFGGLFLTFQAEVISNLPDWIDSIANFVPFLGPVAELDFNKLRDVIYGSLLILTMIFFPRGLAGFIHGLVEAGPVGVWRSMRRSLSPDQLRANVDTALDRVGLRALRRPKPEEDTTTQDEHR